MPRKKTVSEPEVERINDSDKKEDSIEQTLDKIRGILGAEDGITVSIYKLNSYSKDYEYAGRIDQITDTFLEDVKNKWGGGTYLVKVFKKNRFYPVDGGISKFSVLSNPFEDNFNKMEKKENLSEEDQEEKFLKKLKLYKEVLGSGKNNEAENIVLMQVKNMVEMSSNLMKNQMETFQCQMELMKDQASNMQETTMNDVLMEFAGQLPAMVGQNKQNKNIEKNNKLLEINNVKEYTNKVREKSQMDVLKHIIINLINKEKVKHEDIQGLRFVIDTSYRPLGMMVKKHNPDVIKKIIIDNFTKNGKNNLSEKQIKNIDFIISELKKNYE